MTAISLHGSRRRCTARSSPWTTATQPRRQAIWSPSESVSVLGAWRNARGQREVGVLFATLGAEFLRLHVVHV
jgi:hypothetical protein